MEKTFRPYDPDQLLLLLPPNLREWRPPGHRACFIADVVKSLDLSAITRGYEQELRRYPPYHPVMMVTMLLYGYATGVRSSRRLARACVARAIRAVEAGTLPVET